MKTEKTKLHLQLIPLALILAGGFFGIRHYMAGTAPPPPQTRAARTAPLAPAPLQTVPSSPYEHRLGGMNIATRPWNGIWVGKYPGVDTANPDLDADGDSVSNYDEMLAGTDPYNGKGHLEPNRQRTGMDHTPVTDTYEDIQARAIARLPALRQQEQEAHEALVARATATGTPMLHYDGTPDPAVLKGFDDEGTPVYTESLDAGSADTSGADELWPAASVGGIAGWTTGATGYNLDGGLSDPWNTPAVDPDPARPYPTLGMWENSGMVLYTHSQLSDLDATSSPRVVQVDEDGSQPTLGHNTLVAGILGGGGITDPDQVSGISLGGTDAGNYARGVAFAGRLNAYESQALQSELSGEASATPPLRAANGSFAARNGWSYDSVVSKWRWFGPSGAAQEDFKHGDYTNNVPAGSSPREMDLASVASPFTLAVWSAGNDRNEGPGSLAGAGGNYLLGPGITTSTVPRDWNDGDAGGFDSLPPEATAKNTLTVGAWSDVATEWNATAAEYVTGATGRVTFPANMGAEATFSSAGPTDDGRLKPDVVACGVRNAKADVRNPLSITSIFSSDFDPLNPVDHLFNPTGAALGTSYAAPVATGGVALILQRRHAICRNWESDPADPNRSPYPIRNSTLRALYIHTARDVGNTGPDFKTGYGLVSVGDAAKVINDDCEYAWHGGSGVQAPKPCLKEICLKPSTYITFKVKRLSATVPIRVTMAWTDPAGPAQAGVVIDPMLTGTFTADPVTDVITRTGVHQLSTNDLVRVTTSGTLPAPLAINTDYYAAVLTATTFKLSLTPGGTPVNITTAGTLSHSVTSASKRLKNDLDLRLFAPGITPTDPTVNYATAIAENTGSNCHKPWKLNADLFTKSETNRNSLAVMGGTATNHDDTVNNVEQVVIPNPATGDYTVRVMVKGPVGSPNTPVDAGGFATDQWVSLIITGVESPYSEPFNLSIVPGGGGSYNITIATVPGGIYTMQRSNNLVTWTDTSNANMSARASSITVAEGTPPGWTSVFWRAKRTY